jgi:hypothetical protein
MISVRHAPNAKENPDLEVLSAVDGETNTAWLARAGRKDGILLLGGSSLSHFRIRVAQAHLRRDMMPSFWSLVGVLHDGKVDTVKLEGRGDACDVPLTNGIQSYDIATFDHPEWYPNIAILSFGVDPGKIAEAIERVKAQRSIIDLPRLILPWLGYVWGAGQRINPLLEAFGLPSAAFVETVYAFADIELTPGLSTNASCAEAIWQTAKWWRQYYENAARGDARGLLPSGRYVTRQRAAAVHEQQGTRE